MLVADAWGAIHGLRLAWELGFSKVVIEMDNLCLVDMLLQNSACSLHNRSLIQELNRLIHRNWIVEVIHTFREANKCVDHLAGLASSYSLGVHIL